jgi:multiple sugar transport system substrate-binding protein
MKQLRRSTAIVAALLSVTTVSACGPAKAGLTGGDEHATVNLYAAADPTGALRQAVDACNASLSGDVTVALQDLTGDEAAQREQLTRKLSAKDTTVDLMALPVAWTPEFAATGWAEEIAGGNKKSISKDTLGGPLATATHKKDLFAAPLTTDTQVLWYRTDLVSTPPATWDELLAAADKLASENRSRSLVVSDVQNDRIGPLFTSLVSSLGAGIVDEDAEEAVVGEETKRAADLLRRVGQSAAVSGPQTNEDTTAFLIHSATFHAAQDMPRNVAMAPFPRVDSAHDARPTLGGTNLAISAYSEHQKQALKAIGCLRGADSLRILKTVGGKLPALETSFDTPAIKASIENGTAPLETPVHDAVMQAIQQTFTPIENIDPTTTNEKLETAINTTLDFRAKR